MEVGLSAGLLIRGTERSRSRQLYLTRDQLLVRFNGNTGFLEQIKGNSG